MRCQKRRLSEAELLAVQQSEPLSRSHVLPEVGIHLDDSATDQRGDFCRGVLAGLDGAGKVTVGTKCRSSDRLHRHTGPGEYFWREPNKTCTVRRTFWPALLRRGRRTVTARGGHQQKHPEEEPARHAQTASRASMTLALIRTSVRRNGHAAHLSFSQLPGC